METEGSFGPIMGEVVCPGSHQVLGIVQNAKAGMMPKSPECHC